MIYVMIVEINRENGSRIVGNTLAMGKSVYLKIYQGGEMASRCVLG